jgi:hypothetical protein
VTSAEEWFQRWATVDNPDDGFEDFIRRVQADAIAESVRIVDRVRSAVDGRTDPYDHGWRGACIRLKGCLGDYLKPEAPC